MVSRWRNEAGGTDAPISDPDEYLSGSDTARVGTVAGGSSQEFPLQVLEHPDGDRLFLGDQLVGAIGGSDVVADLADGTGHFVGVEKVRFENVR